MRRTAALLALLAAASTGAARAQEPAYYAEIVVDGKSDGGIPLVMQVVTPRVPVAPQTFRVDVSPRVASSTVVHWSSPDGRNIFARITPTLDGSGAATLDGPVGEAIAVFPTPGADRGLSLVMADIGKPVNQRVSLYVRDVEGISFGCYGYTTTGPSIRFVPGTLHAAAAPLGQADVAVVGPGTAHAPAILPVCSGENYDALATTFRLVFGVGGRVKRPGFPTGFVRELPYAAIDAAHPLEIETRAGPTVRMHLSPAGGAYFTGWYEPGTGGT